MMSDEKDYDVFSNNDDHGQVDHFSEADTFSNDAENIDPFGMPADREQNIYASDSEDLHQEYHEGGMGQHADDPDQSSVHFDNQTGYSEQVDQDQPQKKSSSKLKAAIAVGVFGLVGGAGMLYLLDGGQPASPPMMMGNDANTQQGQMQLNQGVPSASQDDINRLASQLDSNQLRQMEAQAYIEDQNSAEVNPLSMLSGGAEDQSMQAFTRPLDAVSQQPQMMDPSNGVVAGSTAQSESNGTANNVTPVLNITGTEEAGSVMELVNALTGYVDNNSVRINEIERRITSTEGRLELLKDEILSEIAATRIDDASSVRASARTELSAQRSTSGANSRAAEVSQDGFYTVSSGDNLSSIARHFNVPTDDLAQKNGIINQSLIFIGQRLRVDGGSLNDAEIQRNRSRTQAVASRNRSSGVNLAQWKIAGLSPSRAVLIDGKGQYLTVSVGESITGGGRVQSIDVASNRVVTSMGVIQFVH